MAHIDSSAAVSSIGELDVLPAEVVVDILAMVDQPQALSGVCRRMRVLVQRAIEQQNADMGISAQALAQKVELSIHPSCMSILARFEVSLSSLASKPPSEALEEMKQVVDGNLDLLKDPKALYSFLSKRLIENSIIVARYFYDPIVIEAASPHSVQLAGSSAGSCTRGSAKAGEDQVQQQNDTQTEAVEKRPSARTKGVRDLLSGIRGQKPKRVMPVMVICGEGFCYEPSPAVPLSVLRIPPQEICRHIPLTSLRVEHALEIPSGIGSMGKIQYLMIRQSLLTSLPSDVSRLPLQKLWLDSCRNLEHLPESMGTIGTLESVVIGNCPKLAKDNPVLKALRDRRVEIQHK